MRFQLADRVKKLPPYLFAELEKIINEKKKQGIDLISLSIGDPDLPPPPFVLEALKEESANPKNHNYSFSQGEPYFREAVAEWYKERFNVNLDPQKEVVALIGSKEGIANISRAFVNPGDRVLVPDPAYPVYANGSTLLSDGVPVAMPLLEENDFKPDVESLNLDGVKIIFLNYPNNPTGFVLERKELTDIVDFVVEHDLTVISDEVYEYFVYDDAKHHSIASFNGMFDRVVTVNGFSKTYAMTGWRLGYVVAREEIVKDHHLRL